MQKQTKEDIEFFYKGVLSLTSVAECARFFDDIFTLAEREAIVQRFSVARMLAEGQNYIDINTKTGASTATICRVNKCLVYGDGGYKTVLDRVMQK